MNSMTLSSFGNWELVKFLGAGGFGEVTLWKNRQTHLHIATKRLLPNDCLSADEISKLKQRWTQEYQRMRELNTPYLVKGIDIEDKSFLSYLNSQHAWAPLPVIIMEYCNGGDLRSQLQQIEHTNGLPEHTVRQVLHDLRHAIEYLHTVCRIEHRDIKPDNIVMMQNGTQCCYKLTDFGFARNCSENTIIKSVVGTRHYFAPEVVDTALYTNTVDYWSLGIIAYEMMCGFLPFIAHQELFQIIVNIKKKPAQCIAIEEHLEERNRYNFQTELCAENHMSKVFAHKIVDWLRLALDVNYKTRGTLVSKTRPGQRELCYFKMLDSILETRILTVFCVNTYQFYSYEVNEQMSLMELLKSLEIDTQIQRKSFFFVYPVGHPRATLSAQTRPLDIFVSEWQNGSQAGDYPPVMLFLVGYQCELNAKDPEIPTLMKRCLVLSAKEELPPDWQLQRLAQQTHFLLSNEQRLLSTYMQGLREYAMTIENDILNFDENIQTLLADICRLDGSIEQFNSMIGMSQKAHEERAKLLHADIKTCFNNWCGKVQELQIEMQKININLGQSIKKRYSSVLRRAKEQANNGIYEEFTNNDIYGVKNFRIYLAANKHRFHARTHLDVCQQAVYNCLEQRNMFLNNKNLKYCQKTLNDVHEEFRKITEIVKDALKYCIRFKEQITKMTYEFQAQLLDMNSMTTSSREGNNLRTSQPFSLQMNGLCASLQNIMELPTDMLIQEALQSVELMSMDCTEGQSDIPKTVSLM